MHPYNASSDPILQFNGTIMRFPRSKGFTIIELMITLALVAVIIAVAAPAMTNMIKNNRLRGSSLDLMSDIQFARSEAVRRGTQVVLCRSAAPTTATPVCGGTVNTWTTGWLIYTNDPADTTHIFGGTDALLRVGLPAGSGVTIRSNASGNQTVAFNADGSTDEGGNTSRFTICDSRGAANGRQINIRASGHASSESPANNCSSPT